MIKKSLSIFVNVIKITSKTLRDYPRIFIPLSLRAVVSLGILCTIYVIPYYPFKKILGPPVIEFFGSKFLHYPHNFTILPIIFINIKNFLINPIITSIMVAVCCGMVYDYHNRREPEFWRNFNKAVRRFLPLSLCMLFLVSISYLSYRMIPLLMIKLFGQTEIGIFMSTFIPFFVLIIFESLFVFCFIAIMTKKQNAFKALKKSFIFSLKLYPVVFFLVFLPRLLDLLMSFLIVFQVRISDMFIPDIAVLIFVLIILIAIISDTLVFSLIANLYVLSADEN